MTMYGLGVRSAAADMFERGHGRAAWIAAAPSDAPRVAATRKALRAVLSPCFSLPATGVGTARNRPSGCAVALHKGLSASLRACICHSAGSQPASPGGGIFCRLTPADRVVAPG